MADIAEIERRILAGEDISYEDYQAIRAERERLNDLEEILLGKRAGVEVEKEIVARATGPAVAIVVGHTKNSPGASGGAPIHKNEYPWNKDLAAMVHQACMSRGVQSKIFFRDGIGISGAYKQVAKWGASCVMELHFNAYNGAAHGTETLYDEDKNAGSKAWAQRLQDAMLGALGLYDRGLKERDKGDRGYGSVSALDIPSALTEPFFGDKASDAHVGEANKQELAEALAAAAAAQLAPPS
ncbi:N-acetylmuramoyl-L-alanine amidase [Stappia stellulata]|uniref:N-acetylmuramoyl-L-alanine amidase n=1 Tax=Stappia stellulata TaxID=71235 RepID=UPI000426EB0B|nr:N-acetylmuramoyl-L-alanine amidase [Stappia stellulata]